MISVSSNLINSSDYFSWCCLIFFFCLFYYVAFQSSFLTLGATVDRKISPQGPLKLCWSFWSSTKGFHQQIESSLSRVFLFIIFQHIFCFKKVFTTNATESQLWSQHSYEMLQKNDNKKLNIYISMSTGQVQLLK